MKFPIQQYLAVKADLAAARRMRAADKAAWQAIRDKVPEEDADELDYEFKMAFDKAGVSSAMNAEKYEALKALTDKGASARMQDDYELGFVNLAQVIDNITYEERDEEDIAWTMKVIRLTLAADASIETQRSYVGNGGAISLEILLGYKTHLISSLSYTLITWIIHKDPERRIFQQFLVSLGRLDEPSPKDEWFEKTALALIATGYCPFDAGEGHDYMSARLFAGIFRWLHIILPYEDDQIKHYITALKANVTEEQIECLLGAASSSAQNRKQFKEYFSQGKHWLMERIISITPALLFSLVKRNERDLLAPFLKRCRAEMRALRNEKGIGLLEYAKITKGVSPRTIQLFGHQENN